MTEYYINGRVKQGSVLQKKKSLAVERLLFLACIFFHSFKDVYKRQDDYGYIVAGEEGITSMPGIFAAGDLRTKALRQVVTAVSDGANAVTAVQEYLLRQI